MKSSKRKKRWWLLILPLLLIIGAVGFWLAKGRPGLSLSGAGNKQEALPTAEVVTGSIEVITEGSGSVEAATVNNISLKYGGKFSSILVEEGDQVSEGQILAEYDPDSLDTVIETKEDELDELNSNISSQSRAGFSSITSPVSGRIKKIYAEEDDDVSDVTERYGGVAEISADGKLKVEFTLVSGSGTSIHPGDEVRVEVDRHMQKGTIARVDDRNLCVTISDDGKNDLGESAEVTTRSGERLGSGKLTSNHPYLVRFDYGIIDSVRVEENESVYSGMVLFTLRDAAYNRQYLQMGITNIILTSQSKETLRRAQSFTADFLKSKFSEKDSYTIINMSDIMDIMGTVMNTLSLMLGGIAGISLLVGGIGIMNIMLVSVTERTREIGIRKAIGAQRSDITIQFMIESIFISLMGGIIGMVLSIIILSVLNVFVTEVTFVIFPSVALLALSFSIAVGLIFGIYPANKAAKLKPINALRYE